MYTYIPSLHLFIIDESDPRNENLFHCGTEMVNNNCSPRLKYGTLPNVTETCLQSQLLCEPEIITPFTFKCVNHRAYTTFICLRCFASFIYYFRVDYECECEHWYVDLFSPFMFCLLSFLILSFLCVYVSCLSLTAFCITPILNVSQHPAIPYRSWQVCQLKKQLYY